MGIVCDKFRRKKITYVTDMPYGDGKYTGFVDNKARPCTNYGELQYADRQYHGGFYRGLYHGDGTLRFSNGDYYSGEWAFGKKNGAGVSYVKYGNTIRTGTWKNDQLVK